MPKKSYITVTDQFCGAGGSSQGVRLLSEQYGGGLEVKLALNHWKLAIETHNTNFPDTLHDCTDVSACDPRRYPSTDILITSPECTNHSLAKGVKVAKKQMDLYEQGKIDPAAERSRATMWDVPRFAEYHKYNAIIVENVVDARKWVMFDAWLLAMHSLGYNHQCVYLNSMHCHPTPQSRDRMYVVFWKKGNKAPMLDYQPLAHCPKCEKDIHAVQTWKQSDKKFGKYKQQYVYCCPKDGVIVEPYYYAAFNSIDWSDRGTRIGDRPKGLAMNTTKRIQYGIDKYSDYGFVINDQHSTGVDFRVRGLNENISTITTMPKMKVVMPFIIKLEHSQKNAKPCSHTFDTQTIRQSAMLINQSAYVRNSDDPLQTQTTCQSMGVIVPLITQLRNNQNSKPITNPLNIITAGGIHSGIVTTESWNSFISAYYNGSNCTKHITEELGTITTGDRMSIVSYKKPNIEDCYYRMLKPFEVKLGMAFDKNYIILGNARDQVKQCGNAVTPPAMKWLVQQVIESLK